MDQINEALDRLSELSDEELSGVEGNILSEFDALEGGDTTPESVKAMTKLADALENVRSEIGTRAQAAEELFAAKEAASSRIAQFRPAADDEDAVDGGADDAVEGDAPPADDPEATDAPVPDAPADDPEVTDPEDQADGGADEDTEDESDDAKKKKGGNPFATASDVTSDTDPEVAAEPEAELAAVASDAGSADPTPVAPEAEASAADAASAEGDDASATETSEDTASEENDTTDEASAADPENDQEKEHPVTASGAEPDITPPADRLPAPTTPAIAEVPVVITAGADIPGVPAGNELPDLLAVADGMVQRMHAMRRTSGGDGEQHIVASLQATYPEDRQLHSNQEQLNGEKIDKVTSPEALVAGGGLCAPVNVRYDLFGLGELGRPVKDSLAPFNADRGGIRFVTPPTLADFSGAVALWTVQDDIDASTAGAPDPVKPCIRINCGAEVTVLLDAITLCLTFGNLGARAYPEMVKRNNELGLIQHARFAETRLLTRIGTLSTSVSAAEVLGAARDFFVQVEKAAAAYRSRHRMSATAPLRTIAPIWLKNMIRADLTMQLPGNGNDDSFTVADAEINGWFRTRNINVTWHIDGESGQIFGAQAAGALNSFPTTVVWYIFAEGTFLFLDGGTLDLGLVRDSTLNGTNDYKMFVETFEGVAKVGIESLRVASTLRINGSSSGTRAITAGTLV
jgi:hypothetical protein